MHLIDQELNFMLHGEFDKGWEISEELEALGPDRIKDPQGKINPEMWTRHQFNRGWFLLQQGKFQEGHQVLESGRFLSVYGGGHLQTDKPIWKGEDLKDKTIILSLEGGFGDEIIHVRFAKSLADKGATVIVAASPEIHSIFTRVPGVSKVITRGKEDVDANPHDFWMPGFSAGWVCGHTYEDLPNDPYLFAIPESTKIWENIINSKKLKVGIRWSGNPKFEHQQFRQFDAKYLTDLKKYNEIQLYSLQRDNDLRELDPSIVDLQYLLLSWEDTLAAISNMDIIITSCTSIAHAAAALGKPTWVITPILPYHTWAKGAPESTTSDWYPNVKLFRQKQFGKWDETFEELYDMFEKEFDLTSDTVEVKDAEFTSVSNIEDVGSIASTDIFKPTSAPTPTVKNEGDTMKQDYVFIAGLPKSGGNVIEAVLAQNPAFKAANDSGLYELLTSINYNWSGLGCSQDPNDKLNVLAAVLSSYHANSGKGTVVEKHRSWIDSIPLLESLTGQKVKIIVPVRNPADILAVYETQRKNNFLNRTPPSTNANEHTIAGRCMMLSSSNGPMGLSHAQTLDAVTSGFKDRLLFVDYNKFCNEPKSQIARIYEFIGKDVFEHDTSIIKRDAVVAADVLGFDLYQQYNSQVFWQSWV